MNRTRILFISVFVVSIFLPTASFAKPTFQLAQANSTNAAADDINTLLDTAGKASSLNARDPRQTAAYIIFMSLTLVGVGFTALVAYAGFLWLTAAGEEDKLNKAKDLIKNGIIGLVIVLSAYGITRLIFNYAFKAAVTTPLSPEQYTPLK